MKYDVTIQKHGNVFVVRDDLIKGGTKRRAMSRIGDVSGMIYAGPSWGGAAVAMSYECKERGIPCVLFYPKRKSFVARQMLAKRNGAKIVQVPFGRLSVIKHRAKEYQKKTGYCLVKWGGGDDASIAIKEAALKVKEKLKDEKIDSLWCASGSGTLIRALSNIFDIPCYGVVVGYGLKEKDFPNVKKFYKHPFEFKQQTAFSPPFPSCRHYDAKAFEIMKMKIKKDEKALFWNVMEHHI